MNKIYRFIRTSLIYVFPISALILSLYAKETSSSARNALYLCIDIVIPSLFPFFVLSRIMVPYISGFSCPKFLKGLIKKFFALPYYTIIIILLGYLSGYPTGAKLTRDMLDEGLLDSRQADRIIPIANNCSPLFMVGTIGAGLFKSVKIGFMLLLIHWLSGLAAAFFMARAASVNEDLSAPEPSASSPNHKRKKPGGLLGLVPSAIEESAILCIKIAGYIVFFAVLTELLSQLGLFTFLAGIPGLVMPQISTDGISAIIPSLLRGIMEITSGAQSISRIQNTTIDIQLTLVSLICGFAGFSVHTQVMGIMKGTGCKYRFFFTGKLLHGLIAGLTTFLFVRLIPMSIQVSGLEAVSEINFSGVRPVTIGIILLSLAISSYRPDNRYAKKRRYKF